MNIEQKVKNLIDCNCDEAYKSRGLSAPDCPQCNYAEYVIELVKDELTTFLDFLLKNGYCDTDVYDEPPSAIDRYMHSSLNK
ncbi:MAG TPA: hypothetical protein ENH82_08245 [bacterium]|nr:hypothetical protein [bacterium]